MKKIAIIIIPIFLLCLSHCNKKEKTDVNVEILQEKTENAKVEFNKISFVGFSNIYSPGVFLYDDNVHTFGYNLKDKQLIINRYDKDLVFIDHKYLPIGQGPGDVGTGCKFFPGPEYLYAPDNTQRRISIFDKSFNYIKLVKTDSGFNAIRFNDNGNYFLYSKTIEENPNDIYLDITLVSFPAMNQKVLYKHSPYLKFDYQAKQLILGEGAGVHYFFQENNIFYLNMKTYEITKFTLAGQVSKRVKVEVDEIRVPKEKKESWLKDQLDTNKNLTSRVRLSETVQPASWLVSLGKGFVVLRRRGYGTECTGMVEGNYFNYELELIGKIKFPCFRDIFKLKGIYIPYSFVYRDGYLFTVYEDIEEFKLTKWQVTE